MRRLQRALPLLIVAAWLPWMALLLGAHATELPRDLALARARFDGAGAAPTSAQSEGLEVVDRHGVHRTRVRAEDGLAAEYVQLDRVSPQVVAALLAAEDKRYHSHLGVDPIALGRAMAVSAYRGRFVSGASTITQQLARATTGEPRTVKGKLAVMALSVRIEATFTKDEILEMYLNQVSFGLGTRGVAAASHKFFGKPPDALSLAEAATLASIPRGPSRYDPTRGRERLLARRDAVLERMVDAGLASQSDADRAKGEPMVLAGLDLHLDAPHFVLALSRGRLGPAPSGSRIVVTLDGALQQDVTGLVRERVARLAERGATAASAIVVDNASGDILAYVGSQGTFDTAGLGHNDGVLALRQPGSTLKPFVYALAIDRLSMGPATMVPDVAMQFPSASGIYAPQNYDQRFHGPVLVRQALANSYNVPAVYLADQLRPDVVLDGLHRFGFESLDQPASHYGVGIALGDGEVQLIELARAYASLARGGVVPSIHGIVDPETGSRPSDGPRAVPADVAFLVRDILHDPRARIDAFGAQAAFALSFDVAAKTGTSKGFRDSLTVGFSSEVTTAVWVGNFDGSPSRGLSGAVAAGPLFRDVMQAAAKRYPPTEFVDTPSGWERHTVCALSGRAPGPACPHRTAEWVREGSSATASSASCRIHQRLQIDRRNGLLAGSGCDPAHVEERDFEVYEGALRTWAVEAGRAVPPHEASPLCPGAEGAEAFEARIAFPAPGSEFFLDPGSAAPSRIRARVDLPGGASSFVLSLDGRTLDLDEGGQATILLTAGAHELVLQSAGQIVDRVRFVVR